MRKIELGEIPIATQLREIAIGDTAEIAPGNYSAVSAVVAKRRGSAIFHLTGPDEFRGGSIRRITRAEQIQIAEDIATLRAQADRLAMEAFSDRRAAREAASRSRELSRAAKIEQARRREARADKAYDDAIAIRRLGIAPFRPHRPSPAARKS